jgi:hypothetical protein
MADHRVGVTVREVQGATVTILDKADSGDVNIRLVSRVAPGSPVCSVTVNGEPVAFVRDAALGKVTADFNLPAGPSFNVVRVNTLNPADFDGSGGVDPDDLADYIACFFEAPPCPRADFNQSGNVDPDDLADYIGIFFNPPTCN